MGEQLAGPASALQHRQEGPRPLVFQEVADVSEIAQGGTVAEGREIQKKAEKKRKTRTQSKRKRVRNIKTKKARQNQSND